LGKNVAPGGGQTQVLVQKGGTIKGQAWAGLKKVVSRDQCTEGGKSKAREKRQKLGAPIGDHLLIASVEPVQGVKVCTGQGGKGEGGKQSQLL